MKARIARKIASVDRERLVAAALLLFAVGFNLYHLYPEVAIRVPDLNDGVLHLLGVAQVVTALFLKQDPTDPWLAPIAQGYPLFHYYQHLAYLLPAVLHLFSRGSLPLTDVFNWTRYLPLSLFPLSIYWSMRRFGFGRLPSALAGLAGSLLATDGLYGFDFASYVWRGYGLYTQLWGMVLLPPALAQGYTALRTGRGYFWAVVLLAATCLCHLVLGYIALLSLGVLALVGSLGRRPVSQPRGDSSLSRPDPGSPAAEPPGMTNETDAAPRITLRIARLALLLALVALVTAYFWLPYVRDGEYMNRSVWEDPSKYDSYGYAWVLGALIRGQLFDFGRFPVLTLLAGVGLAVCLWRWRDERYRIPGALFLVWLLLYFGRPTWGALLDLLPLARDMHLHRLIAGVHLGGILLVGVGLALPWEWALARRWRARYLLVPAALTALLLFPVYRERAEYLAQNDRWMRESQAAIVAEAADFQALADKLGELPPGRVYAGLPATWGRDYKVGAVPVYALLQQAGFDMLGYLYHALSLNADVQVLFDERQPEQYNLFNVRYVVAPADRTFPDFVQPVGTFGRHRLYQVDTTGYFDLVGSDMAFAGGKGDFYSAASGWLGSDLPGQKQHPAIFLGKKPDGGMLPLAGAAEVIADAPASAEPPQGRVVEEAIESNAYQARIEAAGESTVLLKATYHPGWQATVDGAPTETFMVMPSYVGVKLPAGVHEVRLEYRSEPQRRILLLLGLLTLPLIGVGERAARSGKVFLRKRAFARGLTSGHRPWTSVRFRMALGIYLLCFSIYLLSGAGHFSTTDHVAVYLTTQSLVERHDLTIKPINDAVKGPDGRYYSVFGVGQSLATIPLYLVGRAAENIGSPTLKAYWSGVNLGDWGGTVPIYFVSLFNQFVTPLTCVLVFLFGLKLGFSRRTSLLVTLVFSFGTAAWVFAREYFQHPLESLALLAAVYVLFARQDRLWPRYALFAGLALAAGILTRINLLLLVPFLLAYLLFLVSKIHGRVLPCLLAFSLPILLVLLVWLFLNRAKYGNPWAFQPLAAVTGLSTPLWLGLYGNLFSVGRSIFLYSPPAILALFAFSRFYRARRVEAVLFAAIAVIYLVSYSVYGYWEGGWSWGPRFLVPALPFLVLPLGYLLPNRRWAVAVAALAALGIGVQILGVTVNYSYVYHDWAEMNLSPETAYLWVPEISAIPMHLRALLAGRHIDLWLVWVYQQFGVSVLLLTFAVPLLLLAGSLVLLRGPGHRVVSQFSYNAAGSAAGWQDQAELSVAPAEGDVPAGPVTE